MAFKKAHMCLIVMLTFSNIYVRKIYFGFKIFKLLVYLPFIKVVSLSDFHSNFLDS